MSYWERSTRHVEKKKPGNRREALGALLRALVRGHAGCGRKTEACFPGAAVLRGPESWDARSHLT